MLYLDQETAELGELGPNPSLFRPSEAFNNGVVLVDTDMLISYLLSG